MRPDDAFIVEEEEEEELAEDLSEETLPDGEEPTDEVSEDGYEDVTASEPPPEPARKLRVAGMEFEYPEDIHAAFGGLQAKAARVDQLEQELNTLRNQHAQGRQQTQAETEEQTTRKRLDAFRNEKTQVMLAAQQSGDWETFLRAKNEMEITTAEVLSELNSRKLARQYAKEMIDEEMAPFRDLKDRMQEVNAIKGNENLAGLHQHAEMLVDLRRAGNLHPQVILDLYENLKKSITEELKPAKPVTVPRQTARQPVGESPASGRPPAAKRNSEKDENARAKQIWAQIKQRR